MFRRNSRPDGGLRQRGLRRIQLVGHHPAVVRKIHTIAIATPSDDDLRTLSGHRDSQQSAPLILCQRVRRHVSDHALGKRDAVEDSTNINGCVGLGCTHTISAINHAESVQHLLIAIGGGGGFHFGHDIENPAGDRLPSLVSADVNHRRASHSNVTGSGQDIRALQICTLEKGIAARREVS